MGVSGAVAYEQRQNQVFAKQSRIVPKYSQALKINRFAPPGWPLSTLP